MYVCVYITLRKHTVYTSYGDTQHVHVLTYIVNCDNYLCHIQLYNVCAQYYIIP